MTQTIGALFRLMRFDKPIGITLLLWPTLMALWLGSNQNPPLYLVVIFTLGVVVTRAAGCVINDLSDRKFDGLVARTSQRPLVSGQLSQKAAWVLWIVLMTAALFLASQLKFYTVLMAFFAAFLMAIYPKCKRWTYLPQVVLGMAFSMGMVMAFYETRGFLIVNDLNWLLANMLWVIAYDTCYAISDRPDDKKVGVRSTAILFAELTPFWVFVLMLFSLFFWLKAGFQSKLDGAFFMALAVVALMFIWQLRMISGSFPERVMTAFKSNQWVGFILLMAVIWSMA